MSDPDKSVDIYERLADALDALPSGFTRTPSRLEIRLIKLAFTPEEASLAGQLTRTLETAVEIANRVGLPEAEVTILLESMVPRRMVRADTLALESGVKGLGKVESKPGQEPKAESVKKYRLSPFLVGWYESYLQESKPESKEFAETYEQYVIEGGGEKILSPRPGSQGVIPYRGSLKPEWLEREPHNDIDAHFKRHERFLVIDCVCKKEKVAAHGRSCDLPIRRCGFVGLPRQTPLSENVLTREEATKLWDELDAMGTMVIEGFYGFTMGAQEPQFVGGCHCCGCCCSILNAGRLAGLKETVQRSNYRAVKDYQKCQSCLECIRRCQFYAHTLDGVTDGKPVYDRAKCVGCGSCGMGCPSGALHLEPVSDEEWFHVPSSFIEWEEARLRNLAAEKQRSGQKAPAAKRPQALNDFASEVRIATSEGTCSMSKAGKTVDIYERLAAAQEALPHGFPRTPSGVEIRLIKMAFTPEEVTLAGQLTRTPETAAEIAKRVGMDESDVTVLLERMIPRRLVRLDSPGMSAPGLAPTAEGVKKYRLGPFLVGWYEANMRLLDKEFAEAFEQYVIEGGGEKILAPRPGVLGVVPVRGSLKPELMKTMEPHLDIDAHFQRHDRFLVLPCVCKRERELQGHHDCKLPAKRCGFVGLPPQTPLSETVLDRKEASALLGELEQSGHVHLAFYGFTMGADTPQFVGTCNCCACCCGVLHGQKISGVTEGAQRSNYRAFIDPDACVACGACIKRCPVNAIVEDENGKAKVERAKCIGCGVCVIGCPSEAIEMVPVSKEEWFHVPSSMAEWEEMRLRNLAEKK